MAVVTLKWRKWAKIVAYLDLIGSIMMWLPVLTFSLFSGLVTICLIMPSVYENDEETQQMFRERLGDSARSLNAGQIRQIILHRIWGIVVALGTFIGLQFWAATRLMKATEAGRNPQNAREQCKNWRTISFILSLMLVIGHFSIRSGTVTERVMGLCKRYLTLMIPLIIREVYCYIVTRYMGELQSPRERVFTKKPVFKEITDIMGDVKVIDKILKGNDRMTKVIVI